MNRYRPLTVCLLAAAVLALGYVGFGIQRLEAQSAPTAAKTAVAVVNVNDLIAKSKMNVEFQEEIQKRRAQLQKEGELKQNKISVMRQELDVIPNAIERSKKEREIIRAITEVQAWNQVQQQFLVRDQQTFLIEVYGQISTTVAEIAKAEGYDLVILDAPTPNFERLNAEQLVQVIGGRQVIYRNEKVDITDKVLAQMDLKHETRSKE